MGWIEVTQGDYRGKIRGVFENRFCLPGHEPEYSREGLI
jgi:hypothetical protein